jgi:hypothetical protein
VGLDETGLVRAEQADSLGFGAGPTGQAGLAGSDALQVLDAPFELNDPALAGGHGEGEEEAAHESSKEKVPLRMEAFGMMAWAQTQLPEVAR